VVMRERDEKDTRAQGDQIGQIFAPWAFVYLREFLYSIRSKHFGDTRFQKKSFVLEMTKYGLGFILGDFFQKSIWSLC
jgi:hypothetical protein